MATNKKPVRMDLTADEYNWLLSDMEKCNYGKVAAYLRDKIFEPQKLDTDMVQVLKDLRRAYAQVNNNINQIAKHLNTFKHKLTEDDFELLKDELCVIDEYVRDIHSVISDRFEQYETA